SVHRFAAGSASAALLEMSALASRPCSGLRTRCRLPRRGGERFRRLRGPTLPAHGTHVLVTHEARLPRARRAAEHGGLAPLSPLRVDVLDVRPKSVRDPWVRM